MIDEGAVTRTRLLPSLLALLSLPATGDAAAALTPSLRAGEAFSHVFSRSIVLQAAGFDDAAHRVSGSATYRVVDATATPPSFRVDCHYDGDAAGGAVLRPDDGVTHRHDGTCAPDTDASGPAYDPRLWGRAPGALRVGQRWTVDIAAPWELGPAGRQTVTVVAFDQASRIVSLEREGSGNGPWLGDAPQLVLTRGGRSYTVTRQSGRAHWHGRTTFREGVVLGGELMSTRPVVLSSPQLGRIEAIERRYLLLDATPGEAGR